MKYSIALLALLANLSIEQTNAITVYTTSGQVAYSSNSSDSESEDDATKKKGKDSSSSSSSSSDDDKAHCPPLPKKALIQLEDDEEIDHSGEFFPPGHHEMLGGGGYDRVVPPNFAADDDDIFMRSMIKSYALEQKTKAGLPSGKFWMDEAGTRAACTEVLHTNTKMPVSEIPKYLDTYFSKAWGHFDVNRTGKIEVIKMPMLMRFISSDQYMYLW